VLCVGLDLFLARAAPSKTFDQLNPDFNHGMLLAILAGLVIITPITQIMAKRSDRNKAWLTSQ
jgi:hypothetical protein